MTYRDYEACTGQLSVGRRYRTVYIKWDGLYRHIFEDEWVESLKLSLQ